MSLDWYQGNTLKWVEADARNVPRQRPNILLVTEVFDDLAFGLHLDVARICPV